MSAIITHATRVHTALSFIQSLEFNREPVYLFAGKIDPWENEVAPPDPKTVYDYYDSYKRDIVYIKRMNADNCMLGIKRYDWNSGTIYTEWRSDIDTTDYRNWLSPSQPPYVLVNDNGDYNVYLCISNNFGSPSTIKPSGKPTNVFTTVDGYKWKFMFNLMENIIGNFLTSNYIPVPYWVEQKSPEQIDVETNVTPGTIDNIVIANPGSGYNPSSTTVTIIGDGTGAEAVPNINTDGTINHISVINSGYGYTEAKVVITGEGADAQAIPMVSPINGHGNAALQLGAYYVLIRGSFVNDEGGLFPTKNSYRKVGLIKNVLNKSGEIVGGSGYNYFDTISLNNITGTFPYGQKIVGVQSGATAIIFEMDPPSGSVIGNMKICQRKKSFIEGEIIQLAGVQNSPIARITSITQSDIEYLSGDIIYMENVLYVSRKLSQSEIFNFSIEF